MKVDEKSIKGIWDMIAKIISLLKYFFKFLVWIYPSVSWNAKIGKAILPSTLKKENGFKIASPKWSHSINIIAIIFKVKLLNIKVYLLQIKR